MEACKQILLLLLLACTAPLASGSAFRGSGLSVHTDSVLAADLKRNLLEWAKGGGGEYRMTEENLLYIEDQTRSAFVALPKNIYGNLEHSAVRYALHRFFVQTHGMYMKGLEPNGESWGKHSPTGVLEDRVPAYIHSLFESLLGVKGFNHHELAVLAATIEHLVHEEQVQRLKIAYDSHGLSQDDFLEDSKAAEVIESYMALFLLGKNHTKLTLEELESNKKQISSAYPNWSETSVWLQKVRHDVLARRTGAAPGAAQVSFQDAAHIVEEVGRLYGTFQNRECKGLKNALIGLEDRGSGRVKIQDFYRGALHGNWQFSEKPEYLKGLGALDESDPQQLRVFIPNYLNSLTNCIVSSSFFSVCCMDECEGLMGQIERQVAAPHALPSVIAQMVQSLASSTTDAPRDLSPLLLRRLDEIAQQHGGHIPLHGRLFAQWMHHAFPRECPYPHLSGSIRPQTADEWMQETGGSAQITKKEILEQASVGEDGEVEQESPMYADESEDDSLLTLEWSPAEELFVKRPSLEVRPRESRKTLPAAISYVMLLAALVAMALNIKQNFRLSLRSMVSGTYVKKDKISEPIA